MVITIVTIVAQRPAVRGTRSKAIVPKAAPRTDHKTYGISVT